MTASSFHWPLISDASGEIGRRRFLELVSRRAGDAAVAALAVTALPGCTLPVRSFQAPPGPLARVPLGSFPELGKAGGIVKVRAQRGVVFLRNLDGESFEGISAVCTHQGCIVEPRRNGFRCPCHGSTYDAQGGNTGGPARRPLAHFSAERRGDVVVLWLDGGRARSSSRETER